MIRALEDTFNLIRLDSMAGLILMGTQTYFSDGSVGSYQVSGAAVGWVNGASAEFNAAFNVSGGGAESWSGTFYSGNFSLFGITVSLFGGGGWFGVSAGPTSRAFGVNLQANEFTTINKTSGTPQSCACKK